MSNYEALLDKIVETGVSREEAEHAVKRCALAMSMVGLASYEVGVGVGFFLTMGTASMPLGLAAGAVGAGATLMKAPQCSEVRTAIRYWNTANF